MPVDYNIFRIGNPKRNLHLWRHPGWGVDSRYSTFSIVHGIFEGNEWEFSKNWIWGDTANICMYLVSATLFPMPTILDFILETSRKQEWEAWNLARPKNWRHLCGISLHWKVELYKSRLWKTIMCWIRDVLKGCYNAGAGMSTMLFRTWAYHLGL